MFGADEGTLLPDIGSHRKGRAPMGESFQSMGRMTGAAGFKRDSVQGSSRGMRDSGFNYGGGNTSGSAFGMN